MPVNKFKQAVAAIFTSKLIYCITVYGGIWNIPKSTPYRHTTISKEDMRKLQILQNKAMRIETRSDYETPTKTLLEKCNQLSVHQLVAYHTAVQTFKIMTTQLPTYHYTRFQSSIKTLRENRRNTEEIFSIHFKLNHGKSTFFCQGSLLWNAIPEHLKNSTNVKLFKKGCKKWIGDTISIRP